MILHISKGEILIEELLYWPVKNRNVIKLGRRVEEINKEFFLLEISLSNGINYGMPNMHRARGLMNKIKNLLEKAYRLSPNNRFDKLVRKEFIDSLFAQQEYCKFFFTKRYNKEWGMRSFLNYAFLPEKLFRNKPEENGAMAFLENKLRNINYRAQTKRENLMEDMDIYEVSVNPSQIEEMILEQLPRLRRMIAEYNLEMGFETKEQIESQALIEEKKEIEKAQKRLQRILGPSMLGVYELLKTQQARANKGVLSKPVEIKEELSKLIYDLVFNYEEYCAFDGAIKTIEVNADRFHFFKDKKTGRVRFYSGDLDISIGHENYHRLQNYFSRFMPHGLRDTPGEYNITGRTIIEGAAVVLEDNFMEWLIRNRRKFNLSKNDIKIADLYETEYFGNKIIRLCHALYHREVMVEEGKTDYDAHRKLASVSRVPVLGDDEYLDDESIAETFEFAFYFFWEKYLR